MMMGIDDVNNLEAENERLHNELLSKEKQLQELRKVLARRKDQIQSLKYMIFDEREVPKDKFTMYYRIAQNERRTKSHQDLCTNVVKKLRSALREIKKIAAGIAKSKIDTYPYGGDVETWEAKRAKEILTKIEEVLNKNNKTTVDVGFWDENGVYKENYQEIDSKEL